MYPTHAFADHGDWTGAVAVRSECKTYVPLPNRKNSYWAYAKWVTISSKFTIYLWKLNDRYQISTKEERLTPCHLLDASLISDWRRGFIVWCCDQKVCKIHVRITSSACFQLKWYHIGNRYRDHFSVFNRMSRNSLFSTQFL